MSFSSDVKTELSKNVPETQHCLRAELTAFLVKDLKTRPETALYEQECCERAFLRGMFLAAGSLSDPNRTYNLEFTVSEPWLANEIQTALLHYEIRGKIVFRSGKFVVYVKDGDQISDFLKLVGASLSTLELENVRVLKEMRNRVNRNVNCETANLHKTITAGLTQTSDIEWISANIGLEMLPQKLREIAEVRLQYPEATLEELGEYLNPPIGKSGVNHRLRELHRIAEEGGIV